MHDRLKERGQEIADEIEATWENAEDEGRQLSRRERARVEALLDEGKGLQERRKLDEQVREVFGDGPTEVRMSDPNALPGTGWAQLAEAIASKRQRHVELPTESLLRGKAVPTARTKDLTTTDLDLGASLELGTFSVQGMDSRFLYPRLQVRPVSNELSVSDFRQTGSRSVTGNVLRELTATGTKAELDVEVAYVTEPLKQVAITVTGIPLALLRSGSGLRAFLGVEAAFQLSAAIDDYVITELFTSDHPFDAQGTGPIARLRNAVSAHRQLGYNPSVAAVSPATAAELDLTAFDSGYQFNTAAYGSSSPLWNLQIVEVAGIVDPLLIDTAAVGVLALGPTKVDIDEASGFRENTADLRFESSVLLVIRQSEAAYEIGIAS